LSREELLSSCVLLLFAGHETTTQLFGNGALALMRHPAQLDRLVRGQAGVANAVDEILRWDGPTVATVRIAREDCEIAGQTVRRGARLHLLIGAANRDPREFPDPDRFDIGRDNARRQINFGYGPHVCLGARLARLEGAIGFAALAPVLQQAKLRAEPPDWSDSLIVRGLKSLNVTR
jgi:cytochrome P450